MINKYEKNTEMWKGNQYGRGKMCGEVEVGGRGEVVSDGGEGGRVGVEEGRR